MSGWTEVIQIKDGFGKSGSKGLCEALRKMFATFGVPEEISSDGGPEFVARESVDFFNRWGVKHRLSSAYFPQSNGRAEVAVKVMKRLLEDNISIDGSLNNDNIVRALLQQRNTPDRTCKLSPAEILFGKTLRDTMPQLKKSVIIHDSDQIHSQWHQAWLAKEEAIRYRMLTSCEELERGSRELEPLREGNRVLIQNQNKDTGRPNKWDRQGTIIAIKDNDQCLIKVDGSGRLTLRNRRFLRKLETGQSCAPQMSFPMYIQQDEPKEVRELTTAIEVSRPQQRTLATDKMTPIEEISQQQANNILQQNGVAEVDEREAAEAPPTQQSHDQVCVSPIVPRQSTRIRTQRRVYNAATGKFVDPNG